MMMMMMIADWLKCVAWSTATSMPKPADSAWACVFSNVMMMMMIDFMDYMHTLVLFIKQVDFKM